MSHLLLNTMLALVWALLTGTFEPGNLLVGFVLGYFILFAAQRVVGTSSYFDKVPEVLSFAAYFLWALVAANLRVAGDVLRANRHLRPSVLAVPLEAHTHAEVTLLSNLIALTPGTLVLDVSTDRHMLYVHTLYGNEPERVRHDIKHGLERRLLNLMRGKAR